MDNFDSGSGNNVNLYNSENYHNLVLFLCLIIFTQCYSVESANNCFKVKIKGSLKKQDEKS